MKNVITHFDVNAPIGIVHSGGMAILSGDAPVWKYCCLFHKCVMEGAAVVAVAHGIDTATDTGSSIIVYSIDEQYQIGKTIRCSETS
ncbi:hypothetical protein FACS1894214_2030 [Planctomycetales bacterium]|nr:hypothetical protein FACS1894214_2030 [Planctomycetales bacterium]